MHIFPLELIKSVPTYCFNKYVSHFLGYLDEIPVWNCGTAQHLRSCRAMVDTRAPSQKSCFWKIVNTRRFLKCWQPPRIVLYVFGTWIKVKVYMILETFQWFTIVTQSLIITDISSGRPINLSYPILTLRWTQVIDWLSF